MAFIAIFARLSIDVVPESSAAREAFSAQFTTAVASIAGGFDKTDVAVERVRAGSVVVEAQLRVEDADTAQAVGQALLLSPQDVFTANNGFNVTLYGTPTIELLSSTAAPTGVEANRPSRAEAIHDLIIIVCLLVLGPLFVGLVVISYCRHRRRRKPIDLMELSRTNQAASAVDVANVSKLGDHGILDHVKGGQRNSVASLPSHVSQPAHRDNMDDDAKDEEMQPLSPQIPWDPRHMAQCVMGAS